MPSKGFKTITLREDTINHIFNNSKGSPDSYIRDKLNLEPIQDKRIMKDKSGKKTP